MFSCWHYLGRLLCRFYEKSSTYLISWIGPLTLPPLIGSMACGAMLLGCIPHIKPGVYPLDSAGYLRMCTFCHGSSAGAMLPMPFAVGPLVYLSFRELQVAVMSMPFAAVKRFHVRRVLEEASLIWSQTSGCCSSIGLRMRSTHRLAGQTSSTACPAQRSTWTLARPSRDTTPRFVLSLSVSISSGLTTTRPCWTFSGWFIGLPDIIDFGDGVFTGDGALIGYPSVHAGSAYAGAVVLEHHSFVGNHAVRLGKPMGDTCHSHHPQMRLVVLLLTYLSEAVSRSLRSG